LNFDEDAGMVQWTDLPLVSASAGAPQGYTAFLGGLEMISVYGNPYASGAGFSSYGVGIGTTTPGAMLSVQATSTGTGFYLVGAPGGTFPLLNISSSTSAWATSTVFIIDRNGKVGVGTTTPWKALSVNGKVAFDNLSVAGGTSDQNVCIDTSTKEITYGASCTGSSLRFKYDIKDLNVGLAEVQKLRPVSFVFNGMDSSNQRIGLIAEEVYNVDSRLVFFDQGSTTTPRGVYYENVVPVLVKAIQELNLKIDGFASTTATTTGSTAMSSWLDNIWSAILDKLASLGTRIAQGLLQVKKLVVDDQLCIGGTCVTETQLAALLNNSQVPNPNDQTNPNDQNSNNQTGPTILIQGNNPANIEVGATYVDLGVIARDSNGLDLSVRNFVNGTRVDQISLDTSTSTSYTIDYSATDNNNLTATSTRVVNIIASQASTASEASLASTTPEIIPEVPPEASATDVAIEATLDIAGTTTPPVVETPAETASTTEPII